MNWKDILKRPVFSRITYEEFEADSARHATELLKERGISVKANITMTWHRNKSPTPGNVNFKEFMVNMMRKYYLQNSTNRGLLITMQRMRKDPRKLPWKLENNKLGLKNAVKSKLYYTLYKNDEILALAETKKDAIQYAKDNISKIKHDIICKREWHVIEGDLNSFVMRYDPSKYSKPGKYCVIYNFEDPYKKRS